MTHPLPEFRLKIMNNSVVYAGFWRRWLAGFIDGVIMEVAAFVIGFVVGIVVGLTLGKSGNSMASSIGGVFGGILGFSYYIYFIGSRGQTLGKMAMKIKVVKVGTTDAPGYLKAFLREFVGKFLSAIVFCLGFLWMLWDPQKQTWHDKIAGTVVIKI